MKEILPQISITGLEDTLGQMVLFMKGSFVMVRGWVQPGFNEAETLVLSSCCS